MTGIDFDWTNATTTTEIWYTSTTTTDIGTDSTTTDFGSDSTTTDFEFSTTTTTTDIATEPTGTFGTIDWVQANEESEITKKFSDFWSYLKSKFA